MSMIVNMTKVLQQIKGSNVREGMSCLTYTSVSTLLELSIPVFRLGSFRVQDFRYRPGWCKVDTILRRGPRLQHYSASTLSTACQMTGTKCSGVETKMFGHAQCAVQCTDTISGSAEYSACDSGDQVRKSVERMYSIPTTHHKHTSLLQDNRGGKAGRPASDRCWSRLDIVTVLCWFRKMSASCFCISKLTLLRGLTMAVSACTRSRLGVSSKLLALLVARDILRQLSVSG